MPPTTATTTVSEAPLKHSYHMLAMARARGISLSQLDALACMTAALDARTKLGDHELAELWEQAARAHRAVDAARYQRDLCFAQYLAAAAGCLFNLFWLAHTLIHG